MLSAQGEWYCQACTERGCQPKSKGSSPPKPRKPKPEKLLLPRSASKSAGVSRKGSGPAKKSSLSFGAVKAKPETGTLPLGQTRQPLCEVHGIRASSLCVRTWAQLIPVSNSATNLHRALSKCRLRAVLQLLLDMLICWRRCLQSMLLAELDDLSEPVLALPKPDNPMQPYMLLVPSSASIWAEKA